MGRDETTKEKKKHLFCNMKTKSLAFIAGIIWLIAGFNVCRIGVVSWMSLDTISPFMIIGSIISLILFSIMFVKMLFKNVKRIRKIDIRKRKMWDVMPVKSYVIMIFMITFGILLRRCPLSFLHHSSPLST